MDRDETWDLGPPNLEERREKTASFLRFIAKQVENGELDCISGAAVIVRHWPSESAPQVKRFSCGYGPESLLCDLVDFAAKAAKEHQESLR